MNDHHFEAELRSALAGYADGVADAAAARLRERDYQPRLRSRAASAALAGAAAITVGAVATAIGVAGGSPRPAAAAAQHTIKLASYSFKLPASARIAAQVSADRSCGQKTMPAHPETVTQAGGVFTVVNGGCLHADLSGATAPPDGRPVAVGNYRGEIVSDPAARTLTLYVEVSANIDLSFTATKTGLTVSQLIATAASGLPPCSASMDNAPPCLS